MTHWYQMALMSKQRRNNERYAMLNMRVHKSGTDQAMDGNTAKYALRQNPIKMDTWWHTITTACFSSS